MSKELAIKLKFVTLRAQGFSYERISKKLNVSKTTLVEWGKEFRYEIINSKALILEYLYETFKLTHEAEIEYFGEERSYPTQNQVM